MSIHVALNHVTHYRYDRLVGLSPQVVRLRPAPHCRTRILSYSLNVQPNEHFINWQQDPQANYLARLVFPAKTRELRIEVDVIAEMSVLNPFDFFLAPYAEQFPFEYDASERGELAPYLTKVPATPLFASYLERISRERCRTIDFLVGVNQRLAGDVQYVIRLEPGVQLPEETLKKRSGSCRDSAALLMQLVRHVGLAARFVSGYLIQLVPDVKALDGPVGAKQDFTDLHAWCEVYLPGAGWIGLDPTSGLLAGEGHIPLACTPEPSAAAPVSGAVDECETAFEHRMSVQRIWEAPRVTKPYSDAQWSSIEALGREVDAQLKAQDVRLTMGGEPTFVSIDDPDGAEWNTAALGPNKRRLAADLYHRLRRKYAPSGLAHFGQGKWYPGEQLPRWSLNCYWRRDGEPLWSNPKLIADEHTGYSATQDTARRFLARVAEELGLEPTFIFPAYEDPFYYLWRERRLPSNVDPFDSRLEDPMERARLAEIFERGLDETVGHVLPIARTASGDRWRSGSWYLRTERCYLVPGDSPMGYRLPLDSQPWTAAVDYPFIQAPDPSRSFSSLPSYAEIRRQFREHDAVSVLPAEPAPRPKESAGGIPRTAMCAQARNGVLYIFMPPAREAEHYVELVAAVEAAAEALAQPVILEGYDPPSDPRIGNFRVTPDPGVIEVNIHPSADWNELSDRTTFLYEAARESRLTTEKFMLDGRHTGTGGGNHIVLGGPTAPDSPFLRRPDLLRSLLSYWHNHPSLSYLFSGLFIGPTSQAPRVDEARNDSLYELEIAFRQFPKPEEKVPPWLVDRLLRNLLIDASGNTHRSEFCIDKLYSPDGPAGRLGLLEMRAFEMPPHARMSLTQQLLLRAMVARFWRKPYAPATLVRWGTELHDRFLMPYFVEQDFADVIAQMREDGFALETDWFAPHFEFRFPKYGDIATRGIQIELRQALEPWHVMGEEGSPGGTVRYVDSSVERLQLKASGLAPQRYLVTCNGRAVPLQPTGRVGEFVGAVRYRAWRAASALHPSIGVHAPLTFDLYDTWMNRSLGGCRYHVTHPGGRSHERFPVNSFEAESRRLARFFRMGHTPGATAASVPGMNAEYPFTLDLRFQ
ncbi:MAG TPA: transglutaminase family protein [Steroidobacteraceae bacterium]|nr:transglutaminase family protein [Steroidobacteraceae bacterium]